MDKSWKEILQQIRIYPQSPEVITLFLLICLGIIAVLVTGEIIRHAHRKKRQIEREWYWFHKLAEAKDLSQDEAKALTVLARTYWNRTPHRLLQSIGFFDESVRRFLDSGEILPNCSAKDDSSLLFDSVREKFYLKEFYAQDDLSSTRQIPPGQTIRIVPPADRGHQTVHTATVCENIRSRITLQCPTFKEHGDVFVPGSSCNGYYWRERDAGYHFVLEVIGKEGDDIIGFTHSENLVRRQRRHFFRIKVHLTARVTVIDRDDFRAFQEEGIFPEAGSCEWIDVAVVSLSGGGLSFFSTRKFTLGEPLRIEISLIKKAPAEEMAGRVTRVRDFETRYKVFVEFAAIKARTRQAVIHFVSQYQQKRVSP